MDEAYETVKLNFAIHKFSSYSANYVPQNILVNKPTDQLSRWFTDSNTPSQFIMLKLSSPAIVEKIVFGKYIKAHVSDLKKFKIFGGVDDENLSELLSAGLKNDSAPETFRLRHRTKEGLYLPVRYIKILPVQSWGPAYNYTIWYVELHGKNQDDFISSAMETINLRKEEEAVRILLKHLRRRRYKDAFEALSRESGVRLEGGLQARLWNALVENADFELTEQIFDEAVEEGELDWYMSWQPYKPKWRQLSACSAAVEERLCWSPPPQPRRPDRPVEPDLQPDCRAEYTTSNGTDSFDACDAELGSCCNKPGPRGGHQLVCDSTTGTLYLFGGWNGTEDLDDLWSYSCGEGRWRLECPHSGQVGGPTPRSCHKMLFDPAQRRLYTLGRYLDNAQRLPQNMTSTLYAYCVESGRWWEACRDTAAAGGPRLVFDHQMCLDVDTQTVYVFGGRVLPSNTDEVVCPQYSGLYAYYIKTDTWQLLLGDDDQSVIKPRVGHSMLFHPTQRRLYIFAGQRNKEQLLDLCWYDVESGRAGALGPASSPSPPSPSPAAPSPAAPSPPPPAAGFTQRATLDHERNLLFVLSGMSKDVSFDKRVYNTLWVFSLSRMTWTCIYQNDKVLPDEPRPRFAHQLVYDPVKKIHYLFGGNPGNQATPRLRLDDLWALDLVKPTMTSISCKARAWIREANYRQLAADGRSAEALHYLRTKLHDSLHHPDYTKVEHFQKLATVLFCGGGPADETGACALSPAGARRLARRRARTAGYCCAELSRSLAAVLGADDTVPDPEPFEDVPEPCPDTWDVSDEPAGPSPPSTPSPPATPAAPDARLSRIALYDKLCAYFRPSTVPPARDIMELVKL